MYFFDDMRCVRNKSIYVFFFFTLRLLLCDVFSFSLCFFDLLYVLGYVDTDMTKHRGVFTTERGAKPLVWCATIPAEKEEPRGGYVWHDNRIVDFTAKNYPND